ncbi:T9SS type A sorting domain-containing protein, partial [candidate division KSB1 bacterium]|nr:T9SS type A sorting domain-containing protein [candidate division KSB1 bacterium]
SRDNKLYALNPFGIKKWDFTSGDDVLSSPAIGPDGTIYVGSFDNKIYALQSSSLGLTDSDWPKFRRDLKNQGCFLWLRLQCAFGYLNGQAGDSWFRSCKVFNYLDKPVTVSCNKLDNTAFQITNSPFPAVLGPGDSTELEILFQPDQTGFYTTNIEVVFTNGADSLKATGSFFAGAYLEDNQTGQLLFRRAVAAYDSACAYNASGVAAHNNLGVIYALLKSTATATTEFSQSTTKGTEMNKANIQVMNQQYQDALSMYSAQLASVYTPSIIKPQIKFNQAWVYDKIDSLELAFHTYAEVTKDPLANKRLQSKAWLGRGVATFNMSHDTLTAISDFLESIKLDPYGAGIPAQQNIDLLTGKTKIREIPLVAGWNLISWSLDTRNDLTKALLKDIMNKVQVVLGYQNGGLVFDPALSQFNSLASMDHFHGYWINLTADTMLTLIGNQVSLNTTPIYCDSGWNLISYLPGQTDSLSHAFRGLMDHLVVALGFNGGGLTYVPGLGQLNTLQILRPNSGYWVKLTRPDTLVYADPLPDIPAITSKIYKTTNMMGKGTRSDQNVLPATEWINVYGRSITMDGKLIPEGTIIKAVDSDGTLCGMTGVQQAGQFSLMPIYRDDPRTEVDEGAQTGEKLHLYFDDFELPITITWTAMGEVFDLGEIIISTVKELRSIPTTFALQANYPNPFNPKTIINYQLPVAVSASIKIYNTLGQEVITLVSEQKAAGYHFVEWNGLNNFGRQVSSGIYLYQMVAGDFIQTRKMLLLF